MDTSEILEVNTVCLQNAVLCADCEVISDSPHDTCRVCGSRSLLSLSCVLGGTLPVQRTQLIGLNSEKSAISLVGRMTHQRSRGAVA